MSLHLPKSVYYQALQPCSTNPKPGFSILHKSQILCSYANLGHIVREIRCSAMTFTPDRDIFDCRPPIVWWRPVEFRLFYLQIVQKAPLQAVNQVYTKFSNKNRRNNPCLTYLMNKVAIQITCSSKFWHLNVSRVQRST